MNDESFTFCTGHVFCRGSYGDYREGYSSRRYSPPARQNHTRQSPPYGDRGIRDPPRGHMRSRREVDDRDHYSRTDREQKRRRSDPMGDSDMNGHQPTRDDRGPRCAACLQIASMTKRLALLQKALLECCVLGTPGGGGALSFCCSLTKATHTVVELPYCAKRGMSEVCMAMQVACAYGASHFKSELILIMLMSEVSSYAVYASKSVASACQQALSAHFAPHAPNPHPHPPPAPPFHARKGT